MLKKFLKFKWQEGQSLVYFAVALPLLFIIIGAAADFAWLYLSQSPLAKCS